MIVLHMALLALAGVAAGIVSTVAGMASLVSYPALLLAGLPPVLANVTNTVALVANGVGAILGSRPELRGHARELTRLLPLTLAGGVAGGAILLAAPSDSFERIVPFLIAGAGATILFPHRGVRAARPAGALVAADDPAQEPPRPLPEPEAAPRRPLGPLGTSLYAAGVFLVGAYGGYFGAAAGVLMLALLDWRGGHTLAVDNALKNTVMAGANLVAAGLFVWRAPVRWDAALPLAVGLFLGGWVGPAIFRRVHTAVLRRVIAGLAFALAAALLVEALS